MYQAYRLYCSCPWLLCGVAVGGAVGDCTVGDIIQVRPHVLLETEDSWTINVMQSIAGGMPVATQVQGTVDYLARLKCDWCIGLPERSSLPLGIFLRYL